MDTKSTVLMYLHKEGKIAEYLPSSMESNLLWVVGDSVGLPEMVDCFNGNLHESKDSARKAAMDYHEEEGCKLYLELYPAPERSEWSWLAQDGDGCWYGYKSQPVAGHNSWATQDLSSYKLIRESPPNPFWRKTLR
jgi:hypothetical protein